MVHLDGDGAVGSARGAGAGSPVAAWIAAALRLAPARPRGRPAPLLGPLVFAIGFLVLAAAGGALLADADTLWHVRTGADILATGRFPEADAWSHTLRGAPWIAKEWLSQVVLAAAFALGGWPAVALAAAASAAAALALVAREASTRLPVAVAALLAATAFVLAAGHTLARPHVLAWPVMVAWTIVLMRAAEDARAPHPAAALVLALWANLHGSYLLGLALVPAFGLEAVLRAPAARRARLAGRWAAMLVLAGAASMLHPYGPGALAAALKVMGLGAAGAAIGEWAPTDFGRLAGAKLVIFAGVAGLALARARLEPYRVALLLGLLWMALAHERHLALLGLIGALVAIEPLGRTFAASREPAPRLRAALAGTAAIAVLAAVFQLAAGTAAPRADHLPAAALDAARRAGVAGAVFNDYGFGGFLIERGVPTFIDGRTELYGPARLAAYTAATTLADPAALDAILADPRIGWTLLRPDLPAVALLDRTPGWTRVHADATAVVHARRP